MDEVRDRELKLALYSRQGVLEHWIVDCENQMIDVYRRDANALQLSATLSGEDALTSPLLPEFACPIASLWDPLLT